MAAAQFKPEMRMSLHDPAKDGAAPRSSEEHSLRFPSRRPGARAVLLGAVAAVALTGIVVNIDATLPVRAETSRVGTTGPTPATAPMSFANVVEKVKGAVVWVKVKFCTDG